MNIFTPIKSIVQEEPVATLAVLTWGAGAVCGLIGQPEYATALAAVGAAILGIRTQVVPVKKAQSTAVGAATDAAMTTAANLTVETVGAATEVTAAGKDVVNAAIGLVTDLVGGKIK